MKNYQYNSTQIEQWGVDAVSLALSKTDTLCRFFKENDKTPLWDGYVIIYKNKDWNIENIIGKVSVQLKGKLATKNELAKDSISYSVKIVDLVNYKKNNGTIYFVILINKRNTEKKTIYYETLTPKKIRSYIKGKEEQETCTINLKRFPQDKYKIQSIFYNFYRESSLGDIPPISLDELTKREDIVKITASGAEFLPKGKKISPIDLLLNNENELSWTAELSNHPTPIPIDLGTGSELSIISKEGLPSILVNGERYDNYLSITRKKNNTIFGFGKSTTIEIPENSKGAKIKFTPSDLLSDRIKDFNFIISLFETHEIKVDGNDSLYLGELISDIPFELDAVKKQLEYYKRIDSFWKSLKVNDDFDIGNIEANSSLSELDLLMKSMNGKEPVHIDIEGNHPYCLLKKEVSNFKILLFLEAVDQEKSLYKVYNYFDHIGTVKVIRGDEENISSKYSALNSDDYVELSNVDFSDIFPSYKIVLPLNNRIFDPANYDLLNLLLAYDKHKGHPTIILETAKDIAGWLLEEGGGVLSDEIRIINYLQTIKRERELTDEENRKLYKIAEKSNRLMDKLGANLLLENYNVAKLQFEELNDEKKKAFKSYPIYHFWQ
jgi:hypothetical protein